MILRGTLYSQGDLRRAAQLTEEGVAGSDSRHKAVSGSDPRNHANSIWSLVDLLRGDFKRSEYGKVILEWSQSANERCPGTLDLLERWDLWRSSCLPALFLACGTEASTELMASTYFV
jgi:hypothetical protein